MIYSYNGWQVGNTSLSYNSFSFDVPTPSTVPVNYTEIIEETEPGVKGMVQMAVRKTTAFGKTAGKAIGEFFRTLPEKLAWLKDKILWLIDWINEHDIMAAVVGLILLLILIPILGIAWARNSKAQKTESSGKKSGKNESVLKRASTASP